ncbi:MAG: hypothetical protein U5L11_10900 [Arhodomonas sp.]|nr:hypothetical protein [Arhodomonas sp.]
MPENRPQAHADLQYDDDRVRITRWTFPPGGETGWHRHEYDYIVVPGTDGLLQIVDASGEDRRPCPPVSPTSAGPAPSTT